MGKRTDQKKNGAEQAVCVLEGYLKAANISHTATADGISVATSTGGQVRVVFTNQSQPPAPGCPTLAVDPDTVLKRERTMSIFHQITEAAGHGRPIPVTRGPAPVEKVTDFFLVSIRHRDFRSVPNPPAPELQACVKIVDEVCRSFFHQFRWLCERRSYSIDDLRTYALMWTTTWLGKYKRTRKDADVNGKFLRHYLQHRFFGEFALRLQRDVPLYHIDPETYFVATSGDVEGVVLDDDQVGREPEIDLSSEETRRQSARDLLVNKLSSMDHDTFVSVLVEASQNTALCPDTRAEARRRVMLHRRKCSQCANTPAPMKSALLSPALSATRGPRGGEPVEVDEYLATVDARCDEE